MGGVMVSFTLMSILLLFIDPAERGKRFAATYICESEQAELVAYNFSGSDWFVQCQQTSYYPQPKPRGIIVVGSEGEIINEEIVFPHFKWTTSGYAWTLEK